MSAWLRSSPATSTASNSTTTLRTTTRATSWDLRALSGRERRRTIHLLPGAHATDCHDRSGVCLRLPTRAVEPPPPGPAHACGGTRWPGPDLGEDWPRIDAGPDGTDRRDQEPIRRIPWRCESRPSASMPVSRRRGPFLVGGPRLGATGGRGRRRVGGAGEPSPRPRHMPRRSSSSRSPSPSPSRTGSTSTSAPTIRTWRWSASRQLGAPSGLDRADRRRGLAGAGRSRGQRVLRAQRH